MARVEGTSRKERQKMTKSGDSITPSRSQDSLADDSSDKSDKGKEEAKEEGKQEAKQEEDKGLLNFDKLRMLYQFVSEIQRKQSGVYEMDEDVELNGLLEHVPRLSDEELFEQSLICEPRAK